MFCQVVLKKKSLLNFGVILSYPDFYYRSILYIDNVKPILNFSKSYFSSLDEAESFCNFVVMNSLIYRSDAKCEANEILKENVRAKKIFSIILKFFIHKLFRIHYKVKNKNKVEQLIKTWVELNYLTYEDRVGNVSKSLCLVLPFPLSVSRQLKYVLMLRKLRVRYCLYGLGYSMRDLITFLLKRDMLSLFQLEYNANGKSASEFLKCKKLKEILVMDDVDPFSCVVNKYLSLNKIRVECTLHGVGTYAPFYFADIVNVFNEAQSEYYKRFRPNLITNTLYEPKKLDLPIGFDNIVFYSGLSVTTGDLNRIVEERVLGLLADLCNKYSVDIRVKLHPNFKGVYNSSVKKFDGLINDNTLNVSLYSTSYYTVKVGKSILIETKEIPTMALFGTGESIICESNLESIFK